jgi:hypothetical protein
VKLGQKVMRGGKTMFYFEEFLAVRLITLLFVVIEVVVLERIFVKNRLGLASSFTLVWKRFQFSL